MHEQVVPKYRCNQAYWLVGKKVEVSLRLFFRLPTYDIGQIALHYVSTFCKTSTIRFFFFIRDNFFELSLGVLKFLAVLSLKFSWSVLNFVDVHKYVNCIKIPYLEQLHLKLDQYQGFLNKMPDFKGKLKEEVILQDKLPSFLKNLNKFWGLFVRD